MLGRLILNIAEEVSDLGFYLTKSTMLLVFQFVSTHDLLNRFKVYDHFHVVLCVWHLVLDTLL